MVRGDRDWQGFGSPTSKQACHWGLMPAERGVGTDVHVDHGVVPCRGGGKYGPVGPGAPSVGRRSPEPGRGVGTETVRARPAPPWTCACTSLTALSSRSTRNSPARRLPKRPSSSPRRRSDHRHPSAQVRQQVTERPARHAPRSDQSDHRPSEEARPTMTGAVQPATLVSPTAVAAATLVWLT